jgi:hypothetical protein
VLFGYDIFRGLGIGCVSVADEFGWRARSSVSVTLFSKVIARYKKESRFAQYIKSEFIGIDSRRENLHSLFP